jgi:hypothetical protein
VGAGLGFGVGPEVGIDEGAVLGCVDG